MIGVVLAVPLSRGLGKKSTYIFTMSGIGGIEYPVLLPALHTVWFLVDADNANTLYLFVRVSFHH